MDDGRARREVGLDFLHELPEGLDVHVEDLVKHGRRHVERRVFCRWSWLDARAEHNRVDLAVGVHCELDQVLSIFLLSLVTRSASGLESPVRQCFHCIVDLRLFSGGHDNFRTFLREPVHDVFTFSVY